MKNLTSALLGSLLALSVVACDNAAKTSSSAPNTTDNTANSDPSPGAPNTTGNLDKPTAKDGQNDATSETRRRQLNSDIRAGEQRNNVAGDPNQKEDGDLESQVRSKLEANLPASALAIEAEDGAITVSGTVVDDSQLQKIEPLAKQIKGVKSVTVKAALASAAKPEAPKPNSDVPIQEQTNR